MNVQVKLGFQNKILHNVENKLCDLLFCVAEYLMKLRPNLWTNKVYHKLSSIGIMTIQDLKMTNRSKCSQLEHRSSKRNDISPNNN